MGLIYKPNKNFSWQASHAALPTKLKISGEQYRIFFSSRDADNRAHVGWFDIDFSDDARVIRVAEKPVLLPGDYGFFDDSGVQACSAVTAENGDIYLYYLGWNVGQKSPLFYTAMGLAISTDGGTTFKKYSDAPILQRSRYDPWMVSGGTVLREESGWIMYYLSGYKFEFTDDGPISWYNIKIARSDNGIDWKRNGDVALDLQDGETNISRMTISQTGGVYRAWFPVKKLRSEYRCGYAESKDGFSWMRNDAMGLETSASGWDSDAIDKMEVIRANDKLYMLYNGNNFGKDGIGLAIYDA